MDGGAIAIAHEAEELGRMKAQADTRLAKIQINEVYSKQIFQNMHRQMPYIVCTRVR